VRIPVLSDYNRLSQPPRRFLIFSACNVLSWFSLVGPVLVLFGRKIDMPASWIGFLISFMPLSMILVVATVPLVTRLGTKKLMVATWVVRNLVAGLVFLIPWAMHVHGPQAGWIVMLAAILGFCVVRAMGVGGWFPWLHEVVPEKEQSRFFSAEMALAQFCIVVVTLAQSVILRGDPGIGRFLLIYGFGIGAGLLSAVWLARVPGGKATHDPESESSGFSSYRVVGKDRSYLQFVGTTALCFSCFAWVNSSIVLYMRDALGFADTPIMVVMAAGNLSVLLTIHFWGRFADHSGMGQAGLLTIIGHSVAALIYLALPPGATWTAWLLPPTLIATSLLSAAYWTLSHRYMISIVDKEHRVGYTNLWILGTAVSMGVTPIIAGYVIEHLGLTGFRIAFATSGIVGIVGGLANYWVVHNRKPLRHALDELINPTLPIRTLARIAWVTVGLHQSNRKGEEED
jgi:Na+/melibiose symporter-like transporter